MSSRDRDLEWHSVHDPDMAGRAVLPVCLARERISLSVGKSRSHVGFEFGGF